MFIKQVSVFMENKPGKMSAITGILREGGIDVRALSIADTTEFGILRMIVREPERAAGMLREKGMTAQLSDVLVAVIEDRTGVLDEIVRTISDSGINIRFLYSFMGEKNGASHLVICTDDMNKTLSLLQQNKFTVISEI